MTLEHALRISSDDSAKMVLADFDQASEQTATSSTSENNATTGAQRVSERPNNRFPFPTEAGSGGGGCCEDG